LDPIKTCSPVRPLVVRCQYSNEPKSSGITVIEVQNSTKPFIAFDWAYTARSCRHRFDQSVAEPLMVSFPVMMIDKLNNDLPKVLFAERYDFV
jgi:hypothetical protein